MKSISLIIPLKNEESTVKTLIESINQQSFLPDEVILVDGGSTDNTVSLLKEIISHNHRFRIIEVEEATPGRGRNIGVENADTEWVAFTDAGIKLEKDWLENLAAEAGKVPNADIIYGNYSPIVDSFFEKCAAISYVSPLRINQVRGEFIASCLLKKDVWQTVGGFPDLRAAEDLIFMEAAEEKGFKAAFAPKAQVSWYLRPDLFSTFSKFILYSKYNVWAGRQWDWHYGIIKQYLLLVPFIVLAFLHSRWWLTGIFVWLAARTFKRLLPHRFEFGWQTILNPFYFAGVMFLILTIDLATFIGWGQAVLSRKP